jgi:hypothetical protein
VDGAFLNDVSTEAGAVQRGHFYARLSKILQVLAGLAEPYPAEYDFPNAEIAAHEMIQRHPASDQVATVCAGRKAGALFTLQGVERFAFDQSNFAARARVGRPRPLAVEVSVALKALAGNHTSFLHRLRRGGCR